MFHVARHEQVNRPRTGHETYLLFKHLRWVLHIGVCNLISPCMNFAHLRHRQPFRACANSGCP